MNRVRRYIRPDLVFSVIGHLAILLLGLLVFGAGGDRPPPPEPMAVELVPPSEAPPPPAIEQAQNEPQQHIDGTAEESKTNGSEAYSTSDKGSAKSESNRPKFELPAPQDKTTTDAKPQRTASLATAQPKAATPEEPQPETQPKADEPILPPEAQKEEQQPQPEKARTQPNPGDVFALPLTLPGGGLGGGLDAPSPTPAMAPHDETAAFRAHVSSCSHLPPEIGNTEPIKVVMRVYFKPDGTLAEPPQMLDATFSPKSSLLMKIAVNALENCQPFTELPKDKYDKWKIMDLIVTPRAMGR
jgi:hypothetical protein